MELRAETASAPTRVNVPAPHNAALTRPVASTLSAQERASVASMPRSAADTQPRNPRFWALLCYAVPFAPALALLLHERRNAFVRVHAAQALAFYGLIAVAQIVLFVALVLIGGRADGFVAIAFGLLFYGLFGVLGLAAVGVWLRLLADAAAGTLTPIPLLTGVAWRIEWAFARIEGLPS